jgi:hypothetical protein
MILLVSLAEDATSGKWHQPRFFFVGGSFFACVSTLLDCLFVLRRVRTVLLELQFSDVLLLSDVVAVAMVCHSCAHVRSHPRGWRASEPACGAACMRAWMAVDRHCGESAPSVCGVKRAGAVLQAIQRIGVGVVQILISPSAPAGPTSWAQTAW